MGDAADLFARSVEELAELQPIPDGSTLDDFSKALRAWRYADVLTIDSKQLSLKSFSFTVNHSTNVAEKQRYKAAQREAVEVALRTLEELFAKFGTYPVLNWVLYRIKLQLIEDLNSDEPMLPFNFTFVIDYYLTELVWSDVGRQVRINVEDKHITEEVARYHKCTDDFRRGVELICVRLMPGYLQSLTHILAATDRQIMIAKETKAKVLAAGVAVGVALCNVFAQALYHNL